MNEIRCTINMNNKVIAIVGPTAVGKTALSIKLAKQFNGEIINGDSMQVYKGMDIGTAKITKEETEGIPHHLIDILEPTDAYSAADFKRLCLEQIEDIQNRNKLPIIVGGSGLYIQSVLYGYGFPETKRNEQKTKELEQLLQEKGNQYLYEQLKMFDPEQAKKIHPNNTRRVIRALEIYESTGKTKSQYLEEQKQQPTNSFDAFIIGLEMDREQLYQRINQRVDMMLSNGLLDEISALLAKGVSQNDAAFKAIGYKELLSFLQQDIDFDEAIFLLKRNSRRFAKRQYTWFKNKMNVHWFDVSKNPKNFQQEILHQTAGFLQDI